MLCWCVQTMLFSSWIWWHQRRLPGWKPPLIWWDNWRGVPLLVSGWDSGSMAKIGHLAAKWTCWCQSSLVWRGAYGCGLQMWVSNTVWRPPWALTLRSSFSTQVRERSTTGQTIEHSIWNLGTTKCLEEVVVLSVTELEPFFWCEHLFACFWIASIAFSI